MGLMLPRKYCKPGQLPGTYREPCVPVDASVDFGLTGTFIVSVQGETWFERDQTLETELDSGRRGPRKKEKPNEN